jgi:hypothetical protein
MCEVDNVVVVVVVVVFPLLLFFMCDIFYSDHTF